jgi:S1-C subfamily serine protease
VKALGNAGGTGSLSSAVGRITGLARSITVSDDSGGSEHLSGLFETNAPLRAGDSGGPLLNASGRVVGMDTAASVAGGSGLGYAASADGYAIPIDEAHAIARRIEAGNASAAVHIGPTAFLGIQVAADAYGGSGAVVEEVVQGSPAAAAGLAPGDLITAVGGRAIASPATLGSIVGAEQPGAHVTVAFVDQSGWRHSATVTLASGPPR